MSLWHLMDSGCICICISGIAFHGRVSPLVRKHFGWHRAASLSGIFEIPPTSGIASKMVVMKSYDVLGAIDFRIVYEPVFQLSKASSLVVSSS